MELCYGLLQLSIYRPMCILQSSLCLELYGGLFLFVSWRSWPSRMFRQDDRPQYKFNGRSLCFWLSHVTGITLSPYLCRSKYYAHHVSYYSRNRHWLYPLYYRPIKIISPINGQWTCASFAALWRLLWGHCVQFRLASFPVPLFWLGTRLSFDVNAKTLAVVAELSRDPGNVRVVDDSH